MDVEPIFCVEQIVVPPDLAAILKAFTKEAIRTQPPNIVEFAAQYFSHLSSMTQMDTAASLPTVDQLQRVWEEVASVGMMGREECVSVCVDAGVALPVVDRVLRLGQFSDSLLDPAEVLALLLTTIAEGFVGTAEAMFQVFGVDGRVERQLLLKLLGFLANRDREISPSFLDDLTLDMETKDVPEVSLEEFQDLPLVQDLFSTMQASQGG